MPYWRKKVVLITGGSSGLGRALAERLADRGACVVIASRDQERLDRVVQTLQAGGGDVAGIAADLTCQADVDRMITGAIDLHQRIDMLIQCVGRSERASVLDTSADDFLQSLAVNFLTTVRCSRAVVPYLIQSGGHLVHIGSLASHVALPYHGGYPVSKFALAAYAQQLRLLLRPQGVHVMLVCPGPIIPIDGDRRPSEQRGTIPEQALRPGGGANIRAIDAYRLADRILIACERRRAEIVIPGRARLLFAVAAIAPRFGDWLVRRSTHP